ncbi:hypothetical protein LEN26_006343 [Aphanomyces euteiches]|nr:hypothetical protein LEN26_006343 [Aphanomyces euteiches]KAH9191118.1 hypothetical protein AeNC1_006914 [Aphanomyces euteiches]
MTWRPGEPVLAWSDDAKERDILVAMAVGIWRMQACAHHLDCCSRGVSFTLKFDSSPMAISGFPPSFSRPQWTPTQEQHMHQLAAESLNQFIDECNLTSGAWALHGFNSQVPILTRNYAPRTFASSLQIAGTIDEVAHIFKRIQPFQPFLAKESTCIGYLDTKSSNHHVAIQWMLLDTPPLIKSRDACILDTRNVFVRDGKRGYACLFQSISIPECPKLDVSHNYVRATIEQSGYVFTEISPGLINVVHSLYIDFKGQYPSCMAQHYMKKRVATIKSMEVYIRQVRIQDAALLYPVQPQKQCPSCRKVFGLLERTKLCSACDEYVCGECCTSGLIQGKKVVPLCIPCVLISTCKQSSSSLGFLRAQIQRNISNVDYPDEDTDCKSIDRGVLQTLASQIIRRSNLSLLRSLEETQALPDDNEFDNPAFEPPMRARPRGRTVTTSGIWEDAIYKFHNNLERFKNQRTLRTI